MTNMLQVGDQAPDFEAPTDTGSIRLSDLRGRKVVLYFYPKDNTPGCTAQGVGFSEMADEFAKAGAVVIGASKDSVASHGKFRDKHGLKVELASAKDNDLVERYGAWVQKKLYGREYMGIDRSTFLIDGEGVIRRIWRKVRVPGHVAEVLEATRAL